VTPPPPPPLDVNERQPWNARMLDATMFSKIGRGRQVGYDIAEVDAFKRRAVERVADLERQLGVAKTAAKKANEALATRADADARADNEVRGRSAFVPEGAVDAMVQGQLLAERNDRNTNLEVSHRLASAERARQEAEALLDRAKANAVTPPPTLTLPAEPRRTGKVEDVPADLEAQARYLRAREEAIDAHRVAIGEWEADRQAEADLLRDTAEGLRRDVADQEAEVGERRAGLMATIDRIESALPSVREVVDPTGRSAGDETERVAS
jgi:hypothetical protein